MTPVVLSLRRSLFIRVGGGDGVGVVRRSTSNGPGGGITSGPPILLHQAPHCPRRARKQARRWCARSYRQWAPRRRRGAMRVSRVRRHPLRDVSSSPHQVLHRSGHDLGPRAVRASVVYRTNCIGPAGPHASRPGLVWLVTIASTLHTLRVGRPTLCREHTHTHHDGGDRSLPRRRSHLHALASLACEGHRAEGCVHSDPTCDI
jgi:hypothetical protein